MHYQKIEPIPQQEAELAFKQGNDEAICDALLSVALYDADWKWVESYCLKFLEYPDKNVRAVAATSLGHLARIHGTIDSDTVIPALQAHFTDPDPEVSGRAPDALDDINMFVKEEDA